MTYRSIAPEDCTTPELHQYLLGTIAPRPIAWVSTRSKDGQVNLAPFSFFNVFGSNPPTLVFSPSRRVLNNTTKHTLRNCEETGECVVNIADYALTGQMVLTSAEVGDDVNEFDLAGLQMLDSEKVKPPRVGRAPAQFECKVHDIISMGDEGGAGHLIICRVVHLHLREDIFNKENKIDPMKVDNVSRLGRMWYSRARQGLFEAFPPREKSGYGFDTLPDFIKTSNHLTGSELAQLAGTTYRPTPEEIDMVKESPGMLEIHRKYANDIAFDSKVTNLAKTLLAENKIEEAWKVLLSLQK